MLKKIIPEIQSLGICSESSKGDRKGGAGPSEGRTILINGIPVMVPVNSPGLSDSPFSMIKKTNGEYSLFKEMDEISGVTIMPEPDFYDYKTESGIPFKKIALLHGKDCLATTVLQKCVNWGSKNQCKFCGIELSLEKGATIIKKTPQQLALVALAGKKSGIIKHVVLTTGSGNPAGSEIKYLAGCAEAVKEATGLPLHAQFAPPSDPLQIMALKSAGVDTVGIHIESFDFKILSQMAPAKASLGLKRYTAAWDESVKLFGPNQVSSFLIAGLGETQESLIKGSRYLAGRGVYPFLIPLRRIPGSLLNGSRPPSSDIMIKIYEQVSEIIKENNMSSQKSKAGCVRCGACSAITLFN